MGLVNLFLKTELSCIPGVLDRYFGKYYNNTLSNAATWLIILWCILHAAFDFFLNGLFKKMKYKQFLRERLQISLWYLGFYSTALMYTGATLYRNSIELFKLRIVSLPHESAISGQSVLGFLVLLTFFLHSSLWESLKYGSVSSFICYSLFALFLLLTQYMRVVEIAYSLTAILSLGQIALNFTKCVDVLGSSTVSDSIVLHYLIKMMMIGSILSILGGYLFTIPFIMLPFVIKIVTSFPNLLLYFCFVTLLGFLAASLYHSSIHRLVTHWLNHTDTEIGCNIVECVLYPPRNDEAYTLAILRQEAKLRQLSKLPSQRNKLLQTLKCVVAIKKKIQQRRLIETSDESTYLQSTESGCSTPSIEITDVTEEMNSEENSEIDNNTEVVSSEEEYCVEESDTEVSDANNDNVMSHAVSDTESIEDEQLEMQ